MLQMPRESSSLLVFVVRCSWLSYVFAKKPILSRCWNVDRFSGVFSFTIFSPSSLLLYIRLRFCWEASLRLGQDTKSFEVCEACIGEKWLHGNIDAFGAFDWLRRNEGNYMCTITSKREVGLVAFGTEVLPHLDLYFRLYVLLLSGAQCHGAKHKKRSNWFRS